MPTLFSEVYETFLAKVDSYDFAGIETIEELEDDLSTILQQAITDFDSCRKNLDAITGSQFDETLSRKEKSILANYMIVNWLQFKITTDMLIKQSLTDKDVRMTSQANHLDTLMRMQTKIKQEIQADINKYLLKSGILDAPDE